MIFKNMTPNLQECKIIYTMAGKCVVEKLCVHRKTVVSGNEIKIGKL